MAIFPERAADQDRHLTLRDAIDHRDQVGDSREILKLGLRGPVASAVVGDRHMVGTDRVHLRSPHALVADMGVEENDRAANTDDLSGQHGAAGRDVPLATHPTIPRRPPPIDILPSYSVRDVASRGHSAPKRQSSGQLCSAADDYFVT